MMWLTEFCSVAEAGVAEGVGVGKGPPAETEPLPQPVNDTRETKRTTTKDKRRNSLSITRTPQLNNFRCGLQSCRLSRKAAGLRPFLSVSKKKIAGIAGIGKAENH